MSEKSENKGESPYLSELYQIFKQLQKYQLFENLIQFRKLQKKMNFLNCLHNSENSK